MNKLILYGFLFFSSSLFALRIKVDLEMKYKDTVIKENCSIDAKQTVYLIHTPFIIVIKNDQETYDPALLTVEIESYNNNQWELLANPGFSVASDNSTKFILGGETMQDGLMLAIKAQCN